MHPLVECVASFLAKRNGPGPGHGHLFVGCSGGPDSVALAHMVATLRNTELVGAVTLVYVDHQLRPDSAADGLVVRDLASQLNVQALIERVDVRRDQASLEDAARVARYAAFERLAVEHDATAVLLAHTQTDQAETVIMRLLRGTGVIGLRAIPPVRGRYWRPLLTCTRSQIEAYCEQYELPAVRDPMNDDRRFLRVRVRADILPVLARENPNIDEALARLAGAANEQKTVWDYAASALLQLAANGDGLCVATLAAAPAGVVKHATSLAAVAAGSAPLEARHQQAVLELIQRDTAGTISVDLPQVTALREYGQLRFCAAVTTVVSHIASREHVEVTGSNGPYHVRAWQFGDRMRPARLKGRSRKLSDLFADAKVPRLQRKHAMIVIREGDGEIVWAQFVGYCFDCDVEVALTSPRTVATNND